MIRKNRIIKNKKSLSQNSFYTRGKRGFLFSSAHTGNIDRVAQGNFCDTASLLESTSARDLIIKPIAHPHWLSNLN
jgi:hypothetical protein